MILIRTLIVDDDGPYLRGLRKEFEAAGVEVFTATTAAAGLLLLGRSQPDILILDPSAGRGHPEDWRRGIDQYRQSTALGVMVVSPSEGTRSFFSDEADLGTFVKPTRPADLLDRLLDWAGEDERMSQAG